MATTLPPALRLLFASSSPNVAVSLTGLALGSMIAGCASYPTNLGPGQACVRTSQCAAGMVCSMGQCTADLTGFGGGRPTSLDAGAPIDTGLEDIDAELLEDASSAEDTGPLPDTGMPEDAFVPPVDAFVSPVDAYVAPVDAFVPPVDAFVPPVDAFVPPEDAFVPPEDDSGA